MSKLLPVIVLTALLGWSTGTGAAVIHIPADQPTIRHGIEAAADGDTVLVADGTWTGFWNSDLDFLGKAITVASESGPEACIIDCLNDGRGFIFQSGEVGTSIVEGFTIVDGIHGSGGAICCSGSSPTIRNMVINQCRAVDQGGGINIENGSPEIINCVIDSCFSEYDGGGISCLNASPLISGCTISNNNASEIYIHGNGGGIACFEGSAPVITDTVFSENHANFSGGGLYVSDSSAIVQTCTFETNQAGGRGGGVHITGLDFSEISSCSFTDNGADGTTGGIYLYAATGLIANNLIHNNQGGGIRCLGEILITGNTISHNSWDGGIYCNGTVTISDNIITENHLCLYGGGITCWSGDIVVSNNIITGNQGNEGGGIHCGSATARFTDNLISGNTASNLGGGIYTLEGCASSFINNLVIDNMAQRGGGIACFGSNPWFWNTTLTGNSATGKGGGVFTTVFSHVRVINSILWGNSAPEGNQVYIHDDDEASRLTIRYSDVEGGQDDIPVDPGCTLGWGAGMIDADPLFTSGPLGDHYLSQTAAGQPATSSCVDTGDPSAGFVDGTTRTDEVPDDGVADMGYHSQFSNPESRPYLIAGLGPGPENPPRIRVFLPEEGASRIYAFQAYGTPHYGVQLTSGNLDGEAGDELLTGPGPGEHFGPHVRGFEVDGTPLPELSFMAYGTSKFGVNVAAGNFDGDGFDEIITGAGPGAVFGPHVRGWNYDGSGPVTTAAGVNFFAYGTPKWGVNVTAGDIDGDGYDEIITGAGPGAVYGAHVRGWNVDGGTAAAIPQISYFAYGTPRYGVRVGCGDIDGDGMAEILTAPGPSPAFGSHIRGWNYDGSAITDMPGVNFFSWPPEEVRYGGSISSGADLNGDGRDEIVVGAGPDPAVDTLIRVYTTDGSQTALWFSLQAFPDGWTHGTSVAAGRF